jgi:hypothetical protein
MICVMCDLVIFYPPTSAVGWVEEVGSECTNQDTN